MDGNIIIANSHREASLNFADWLMANCELSEDHSLWSYDGEDYTNEKLYEIFKQSENYCKCKNPDKGLTLGNNPYCRKCDKWINESLKV